MHWYVAVHGRKSEIAMSQWIEAIYENGAFRPQSPVDVAEGQRVSLQVEATAASADDLADISDLLDAEYAQFCRQSANGAPPLEQVRKTLAAFDGSLAGRISEPMA